MKILQVHNYYRDPGGEDEVFAAETAILQQFGHKVLKYTVTNRSIDTMNRVALAFQTFWSWPSQRALFRMLKDERPDIVHFHNTFPLISPSAYYVCKKAAIPVIQTLHNFRLLCPSSIFFRDNYVCEDCIDKYLTWPAIIHNCYRSSRLQTSIVSTMLTMQRLIKTWQNDISLFVALTEFSRNKFIIGGIPTEKIVVKPNFVHPDPGTQEKDREFILFVGRVTPEKGVKTITKAWNKLEEIPLRIAGDGILKKEIGEEIKIGNLQNVELLGRVPHSEAISLIKKAFCLIFSSEWYECLPISIIEAFACGTPVIASRLGAMTEIIDEERTGLLYNPGDSDDLISKVKWAWSHPDKIKQMGIEARKEYEAKYTAVKNYKLLLEIYNKTIESYKK